MRGEVSLCVHGEFGLRQRLCELIVQSFYEFVPRDLTFDHYAIQDGNREVWLVDVCDEKSWEMEKEGRREQRNEAYPD